MQVPLLDLRAQYAPLKEEILKAVFRGIIESTARAEELSCEEWVSLASALTAEGAAI